MTAARPRRTGPEPGLERPALHRPPPTSISAIRNGRRCVKLESFCWGCHMKSAAALAFVLLISSASLAQDDEHIKRIVDRIEKEIRESHEKTREEIRAIIRVEIQKSSGKPTPSPSAEARPTRRVYLGITADDLSEADR